MGTIVFRLLSVEQWDDTRLSLRFRVLQRDGFRCVLCGRSPATERGCRLHVDHVVSRAQGGGDAADNLRTLCRECNLGRGNRYDARDRPLARVPRKARAAQDAGGEKADPGRAGGARTILVGATVRALTRLADFLRRSID